MKERVKYKSGIGKISREKEKVSQSRKYIGKSKREMPRNRNARRVVKEGKCR